MKKQIAILAGGQSAEHEISLLSAKNVLEHIDTDLFDAHVIGITKEGAWGYCDRDAFAQLPMDAHRIALPAGARPLSIDLVSKKLFFTDTREVLKIDGVFPVLHGPRGEDGTVQGLLTMLELPFVGAGVLGSAVGMDKDVMKRLLRDAGLPVTSWVTLHRDREQLEYRDLEQDLGSPFFLKPANMGSSVGVHKVHTADEFSEALDDAFSYDEKILCEAMVRGREIECAVLEEHGVLSASVAGEVIPKEYYSYEAKYIDPSGAVLEIPATLTEEELHKVQLLAQEVFNTLECRGLGRVDMFLQEDGSLVVNEINTIPGFTNISMYPLLFERSGISYSELVRRLCLAMFR